MMLRVNEKHMRELDKLVGDPGFSDRYSLLSFALSIGIFMDKKKDPPSGKIELHDTLDISIWPTVRMIFYMRNGTMEPTKVRSEAERYLAGGLQMIMDRAGGKNELDSLEALIDLLPP